MNTENNQGNVSTNFSMVARQLYRAQWLVLSSVILSLLIPVISFTLSRFNYPLFYYHLLFLPVLILLAVTSLVSLITLLKSYERKYPNISAGCWQVGMLLIFSTPITLFFHQVIYDHPTDTSNYLYWLIVGFMLLVALESFSKVLTNVIQLMTTYYGSSANFEVIEPDPTLTKIDKCWLTTSMHIGKTTSKQNGALLGLALKAINVSASLSIALIAVVFMVVEVHGFNVGAVAFAVPLTIMYLYLFVVTFYSFTILYMRRQLKKWVSVDAGVSETARNCLAFIFVSVAAILILTSYMFVYITVISGLQMLFLIMFVLIISMLIVKLQILVNQKAKSLLHLNTK